MQAENGTNKQKTLRLVAALASKNVDSDVDSPILLGFALIVMRGIISYILLMIS